MQLYTIAKVFRVPSLQDATPPPNVHNTQDQNRAVHYIRHKILLTRRHIPSRAFCATRPTEGGNKVARLISASRTTRKSSQDCNRPALRSRIKTPPKAPTPFLPSAPAHLHRDLDDPAGRGAPRGRELHGRGRRSMDSGRSGLVAE